jgi:malate dehydrogenase (quinone)
MINVIEKMGPTGLLPSNWKLKMQSIIQSYGESLITNAALCNKVRAETALILGLHNIS